MGYQHKWFLTKNSRGRYVEHRKENTHEGGASLVGRTRTLCGFWAQAINDKPSWEDVQKCCNCERVNISKDERR